MSPCKPVVCRMDGCDHLVKARGLCNKHYLRDVRHGSPLAGSPERILKDDERRLWSRIKKTEGCWVWLAGTTGGYGSTHWEGRRWRVHRLVYTLLVGPIPPSLQLDHLCHNRACCRPDHLEAVTQQENIRRGLRGGMQPTCSKGHEYDTFVHTKGRIERRCSTCINERRRDRYRLSRGAA